jgi:CubicO group peptidase (beta-lactamase class C family)
LFRRPNLRVQGAIADAPLDVFIGVGVQLRRTGPARSVGSYGWDGGMGSSWANDPAERIIGVVLTTDAFRSAFPPPAVIQDFWTSTYAAVDE